MAGALVRKVDHVFVSVDDVEPLFELFTSTLGLPVAWPVTDWDGRFVSGGVSLGNCVLEIVRGDPAENEYFDTRLPLTVRGIAFEPSMPPESWSAELAARGVPHGPTQTTSARALAWTNCALGGLCAREAIVFLCGYHEPVPWAAMPMDGGAIGLERMSEITIGLRDAARVIPRWERLLSPHPAAGEGRWQPGDGPAVTVKESPIDGVAGITLQVRSVDAARDALKRLRLLGPSRAHGVGLAHPRTWGLDVWLTE